MGVFVIKPEKNKDLYVVFNTVTDLPEMWGTRQETSEYLYEIDPLKEPSTIGIEGSLSRTDQTSASIHRHGYSWELNYTLNWAGHGFIYKNDLEDIIEVMEKNGNDPESKQVLEGFVFDHEGRL